MDDKPLSEEIAEGYMCEQGLMKESYDENGELIRTLTLKGKKECKKMLKEKKYQQFLITFAKEEIAKHPERKEAILLGLGDMLKEMNELK
jgi:hypothetical protein